MSALSVAELKAILDKHGLWLRDEEGGSRANLSRANLSRADLSGAYLSGAYLSGANLSRANLLGADLLGANLSGAYLSRANLLGANLLGANLLGANLSRANLLGANLLGAVGFVPEVCCDLLMLHDMPGPLIAYKLVNRRGEGHLRGGIRYEIGERVKVENANTDPHVECGAGINVATLPWVMREWKEGYRVLIVQYTAADIAAIPYATDGKFRLHRCEVVGERDVTDIVRRMRGEPAKAAR